MRLRRPLLVLALVLLPGSPAYAHRLHVDAAVVANQLRVEVYYDDDTPAQGARVTVRAGDRVVAEGRTDDKGVWTCPSPAAGTYVVRAQSVGHAARDTVIIGEIAAAEPGTATEPPPQSESENRAANTRVPWRNLAIGLGLIGAVCAAWLVSRRAVSRAPATR